jgi:hypothetical protein
MIMVMADERTVYDEMAGPCWRWQEGAQELLARQISARGGLVRMRLAGVRVKPSGQAVMVLRGALCV